MHKLSLYNIFIHIFRFVKQPESYRPKHLPYGKYLPGEQLLEDLQKLHDYFINNAERLLKMGSTQGNESFNNIVASKNPKNRFYGGSESTAFRVAAAVSQKTIGHDALSKVCLYSYLNLYYINIVFIFHSYYMYQ